MKSKLIGLVIIALMLITLLPVQTQAATGGSTKILDCEQYKLEISKDKLLVVDLLHD